MPCWSSTILRRWPSDPDGARWTALAPGRTQRLVQVVGRGRADWLVCGGPDRVFRPGRSDPQHGGVDGVALWGSARSGRTCTGVACICAGRRRRRDLPCSGSGNARIARCKPDPQPGLGAAVGGPAVRAGAAGGAGMRHGRTLPRNSAHPWHLGVLRENVHAAVFPQTGHLSARSAGAAAGAATDPSATGGRGTMKKSVAHR